MRLLADENVQVPTIRFLKNLGLDICSVQEAGCEGGEDEAVFEAAQREERILLTWNEDFSDIRAYMGRHHHGIVRLRLTNQRASIVNPILERALAALRTTNLHDTVVSVTDHRIRMHKTSA